MSKLTPHYRTHGDSHTPLHEGEKGNYHLAHPSLKMPLPLLTVPQTYVGGNPIVYDEIFHLLFGLNQLFQFNHLHELLNRLRG